MLSRACLGKMFVLYLLWRKRPFLLANPSMICFICIQKPFEFNHEQSENGVKFCPDMLRTDTRVLMVWFRTLLRVRAALNADEPSL